MTTPTHEQRTVIFTGRVQGVGFRMTAVQFARGTALSGTVRNLPSGEVELIAQGPPAELDEFITRLREHFDAQARTISKAPCASKPAGIRITH
jgi:acylphosphatase